MQNKLEQYYKNEAVRHYMRVVAFAVLGVFLGVVSAIVLLPDEKSVEDAINAEVSNAPITLPGASPLQLRIPEIGLVTPFEDPLGVHENQTIEVPDSFEEVGWYKHSPTPGELGPAVVLGHVDSYEGPAVFFNLKNLEAGDDIYIDRVDGITATFTVTRLEKHEQSGFPTEKVYGNIDHAGLRLITCSGVYNHGTLQYSHNLIVFAELSDESLRTNE